MEREAVESLAVEVEDLEMVEDLERAEERRGGEEGGSGWAPED